MPAAVFEKTHLHLQVKEEPFDSSGGTVLKDPGWLEVYPFENKKDKLLPFVEEKEKVDVKKLSNTKSKTSPPKKLTEAELLTLMDRHGIGTKATAPTHIETNKKGGVISRIKERQFQSSIQALPLWKGFPCLSLSLSGLISAQR